MSSDDEHDREERERKRKEEEEERQRRESSNQDRVYQLYAQYTKDVPLQNLVKSLEQDRIARSEVLSDGTTITDVAYEERDLSHIILTQFNGRKDLPDQKVHVEYLKSDQRLMIPAALYYKADGEPVGNENAYVTLMSRYYRMAKLTYAQIVAMMDAPGGNTVKGARAAVDKIVIAPGSAQVLKNDWDADTWYTLANGAADTKEHICLVFTWFSYALQFNCDIRDVGKLNLDSMSLSDTAWQTVKTEPEGRLTGKLNGWTTTCIAALNLDAVANYEMSAWARAYGVSTGCLPSRTSKSKNEILTVVKMPERAAIAKLQEYERNFTGDIFASSMNMIAMFGLFHLSKDHTFRSNDQHMDRIGKSYIKTLRTMNNAALIEEMVAHQESVVRTAAHPFGLAQTYFVAQYMAIHNKLASPLAVRTNVSPPPVQRFMIVKAAKHEWENLPVGRVLSNIYAEMLVRVDAMVAAIEECPPAYSALHALYGIDHQRVPTQEDYDAVNSLMPTVYGFAYSQHIDEQENKDGLALALSLENVRREKKSLASTWHSLWDGYFAKMDEGGLLEFARSAYEMAKVGTGN
jgi:hypothetical protein